MVLGLALFIVALLPRVSDLDRFLTPDENLWIGRAAEFLDAVARGDWAGTFQVGHPGITTRWTGAIGIVARYFPDVSWTGEQLRVGPGDLAEVPARLMDVLAATRLPTVLLFSTLVVAVYFGGRLLVGQEVALLGAVLLALDPFCLALSRVIHHDALTTVFMTAALVAFALWLDRSGLHWLLLSGLAAGLACLSKSVALFLIPFLWSLAFVFFLVKRRSVPWSRLVGGFLLWGAAAAMIYVVLWPAMWVDPLGTVQGVLDKALGYAESPHERDNFFMGQVRPDPGPMFYPVAVAFRLTPLSLLGAVLSVAAVWQGLRSRGDAGGKDKARWLAAFWGFVILYTAFMTLGAKKFDRYLLPVFPFLDLLAAGGLVWALSRVRALFVAGRGSAGAGTALSGPLLAVAAGAALLAQAWSSLPAHPYYFTAYNPLLGGIRAAERVLLVGWGEGYDKVAEYLNAKPDAEELDVATWYAKQTMTYLFRGRSHDVRVSRQEPIGVFPWTQADYFVVYINQSQRDIPDAQTLAYYRTLEPEHVVRLAGLDYAWIYAVPEKLPPGISPYQHEVEEDFGGKIRLLGYDVEPDLVEFEGARYLVVTLYWQCLEPMEDNYRLYMKLINAVHHVWGEHESHPVWDGFMTADWEPGTIIRDVHGIAVKPGTPPGSYLLTVDWLEPYKGKGLLPEQASFALGPLNVPRQVGLGPDDLDVGHRLEVDFGGRIRLLGYNLEDRPHRPGERVHLTLFWQALADLDRSYTVFNHLLDPAGRLVGQKDSEPVDGFYPTVNWAAGEIVRDQYDIPIAAGAAGALRLYSGLYLPSTGERLPVAGSGEDSVALQELYVGP